MDKISPKAATVDTTVELNFEDVQALVRDFTAFQHDCAETIAAIKKELESLEEGGASGVSVKGGQGRHIKQGVAELKVKVQQVQDVATKVNNALVTAFEKAQEVARKRYVASAVDEITALKVTAKQ